jgi:hypothetical protein
MDKLHLLSLSETQEPEDSRRELDPEIGEKKVSDYDDRGCISEDLNPSCVASEPEQEGKGQKGGHHKTQGSEKNGISKKDRCHHPNFENIDGMFTLDPDPVLLGFE